MSRAHRGVLSFMALASFLIAMALVLSLSSSDSPSHATNSFASRIRRQDQGPPSESSPKGAAAAAESSSGAQQSSAPPQESSSSLAATTPSASSSVPPPAEVTTTSSTTVVSTSSSSSAVTTSSSSSSSAPPTTSTRAPPQAKPTTSALSSSSSVFSPSVATTLVVDPVTSFLTPILSTASAVPTAAAAAGSSDGFWENKKAVGATFGVVGVVGAGVFVGILVALVRKQRNHQRQMDARDTIVWSDKAAVPFDERPVSPGHSIGEMASATPMDAYASRDPYYHDSGSLDFAPVAYRPYASETPREPSVYSQNFAGYGTAMHTAAPQDYGAVDAPRPTQGGLAPPTAGHSSQPSLDSFYGAYGAHGNNASAGQAL